MLKGSITPVQKIGGSLSGSQAVSGALTIPLSGEAVAYMGEYTVDPKFEPQILPTANKFMRDDVTVEAIKVARTSNPSGGTTVYIGGIING